MLIPDYKTIWPTVVINPDKQVAMQLAASHIRQFQSRYQSVGTSTCPSSPIPWYFIGLIHHMESGQNFDRHLYNGDPLSARTIHYPPGRPLPPAEPPFTWDFAAQDALKYEGYGEPKIWQIDDVLNRLEAYNGLGYRYHDMLSPYLFAGTNLYTKGKYDEDWDEAFHKYDVKWNPDEVSNQLGCAGILKSLLPQ